MAHFLLSAAARTLSLKDIYKGGEEAAYDTFCKLRWAETDGEPVCPKCGCLDAYKITTRRRFKCKSPECYAQFSPTSGTILASRKMDYVDLLAAICILANAAKGLSALQLARDLGCHAKTAWILAHKIRQALAAESIHVQLDGVVEIDGAVFGGHVRPENEAANRVDRRLAEHRTGKRRVVIVARERKGRTLTFVTKHESEGVEIVQGVVKQTATLHADEASHWDQLHARYEARRINHSVAFSLDGICTNQAESYFSRLRRMVSGQHHHVSARHLHAYASHAAWLEDHRRMDNGALAPCRPTGACASGVARLERPLAAPPTVNGNRRHKGAGPRIAVNEGCDTNSQTARFIMSIVDILARKAAELRNNYEQRLRKLKAYIAKDNLKGQRDNPERKAEHKRALLAFNKADSFRPAIDGNPQCLRCWMRDGVHAVMDTTDSEGPDSFRCRRCHSSLDDPD